MSNLYKLNTNDFVKGLVSAVIAALVLSLVTFVNQPDFNVFNADWGAIANSGVKAAIAAFVGYIGKNFVSDGDGKVFGKIG